MRQPNIYMYATTHLSLQKRITRILVLTCFILFTALSVSAQYHHRQSEALTYGGGSNGDPDPNGWGLSLSGGYESLTGDAGSGFKGAPVFSLSLTRNWNNFTFNGTVGYASHKPKVDTSFIFVDNTEVGYVKLSNFNTLQFYVGAAYNIPIADAANFYIGANVGGYDNSLTYVAESEFSPTITTGKFSGTQLFFAPKLGINFIISSHVTFSIEGKYNVVSSSSAKTAAQTDSAYTYSVGSFKSYTVTGALNFVF